MTINSVDKMWSRRATSESSPDLRAYEVSITESYQVTHSYDATEAEILSAPGIPAIADAYTGSDYVRCRTRSVEKIGIIFSIVTCQFTGSTGPGGITDSPLTADPQLTWRALRSNEQIDVDGYGFPITTTIGEPVDGLSKSIVDFELTAVRNFMFFNTYAQREYLDSVNNDWFGTPGNLWPPGTVALEDFQLEVIKESRSFFYHKVTCRFVFRVPYNTIPARAWWHRYRNEGYYMRSGVSVDFTGGGGTGAAAYAETNSSNEVSSIVVTARGRGYTSVPTVVITSTTGTGSGATATATRNALGEITAVSVTNGGSNYKSKIVRATDDNGQESVKPVLLKANGFKERNAANAFWIERPKKSYYLPYFALGMI